MQNLQGIRPLLWTIFLALSFPLSSPAQPTLDTDPATSALQSALQPQFTPPAPGTYALPVIDTVTDHQLLNSNGKPVSLFTLTTEKVAVVSFMYTSCADVGGCPLAAAVLQQVDRLLSERPELAGRVTLLSISFDPERDTPARMAEVREGLSPRTDWRFLTSATSADLQPVLADFHQPVAKLWHEDGNWSGLFRHVLKVFLLDADHKVRNIYSAGLFNAQLVLNDIETVLLEVDKRAAVSRQQ
ncbi:MAG: SCO family protein [Deltaproteobacteria bacterium]|nr:SCO family protein [Deltaproteobacteria bacterium]